MCYKKLCYMSHVMGRTVWDCRKSITNSSLICYSVVTSCGIICTGQMRLVPQHMITQCCPMNFGHNHILIWKFKNISAKISCAIKRSRFITVPLSGIEPRIENHWSIYSKIMIDFENRLDNPTLVRHNIPTDTLAQITSRQYCKIATVHWLIKARPIHITP